MQLCVLTSSEVEHASRSSPSRRAAADGRERHGEVANAARGKAVSPRSRSYARLSCAWVRISEFAGEATMRVYFVQNSEMRADARGVRPRIREPSEPLGANVFRTFLATTMPMRRCPLRRRVVVYALVWVGRVFSHERPPT